MPLLIFRDGECGESIRKQNETTWYEMAKNKTRKKENYSK
jgi:hypothetical protein